MGIGLCKYVVEILSLISGIARVIGFFGGRQVASGKGILGSSPPNFYTELDSSNGLEHNGWGGGRWPPSPPLTTPLSLIMLANAKILILKYTTNEYPRAQFLLCLMLENSSQIMLIDSCNFPQMFHYLCKKYKENALTKDPQ